MPAAKLCLEAVPACAGKAIFHYLFLSIYIVTVPLIFFANLVYNIYFQKECIRPL